jgi:NADH dehydrogenase/NADH:ubiquinone oxidoreductase subunit G
MLPPRAGLAQIHLAVAQPVRPDPGDQSVERIRPLARRADHGEDIDHATAYAIGHDERGARDDKLARAVDGATSTCCIPCCNIVTMLQEVGTMTTRSKPVRIFANDDSALEVLAQLRRQSRAEVIHEALAEYLVNHRDELSRLYTETQQAIAAGDIDRLVRVATTARDAEVDAIMATIPT